MIKKSLIQFFLFFTLLIFIFIFYFKYFYSTEKKIITANEKNVLEIPEIKNNLIKDIEYYSKDVDGNEYTIFAQTSEINEEDSTVILMNDVRANIKIKGKSTIFITSDTAQYSNTNYDTNFKKDVKLKYEEHTINTENIDLSFQKNYVWAYKDIIYENLTGKIFADKLEIDLITKNSKIFMDNGKKVKIIGK
jgi:hypothetical protein